MIESVPVKVRLTPIQLGELSQRGTDRRAAGQRGFSVPTAPREREATAKMPLKQNKLDSQDLPGLNDLQDFQGKFYSVKMF